MKTTILAAATMLSLGIGSAYAGDGDVPQADTFFTELPGVIAQAPVQQAPLVATAQVGQATQAYVANSNRGTWLFQGNQDHEGANS
jgi:hypothetical protein